MAMKSACVMKVRQCRSRVARAAVGPRAWDRVYSSREPGTAEKREGVIHGSRTNQPPRLTPWTSWW